MSDPLALWLYGRRVALVFEDRRRLRLAYTQEALDAYPPGTPLLSLSLPLTSASFPNSAARSFLDGLLPEGDARRVIAEDLGVRADDTMALARSVGRESAGALVIQADGDPEPVPSTTLTAEPIDDAQLATLVAKLRSAPLGLGPRVRVSLAGVQEKLLLTRLTDGTWGRPVDQTPSTHILKPGSARYPQMVGNEAFCMRLARGLGTKVAEISTTVTTAGQELLVVTRYDRLGAQDGGVQRLHQEDFCQALGLPPARKYQEDGGPSLRQVAAVLRANDPDSLEDLVRAVTLNVLIGNGDAHGKNFSLLHDESGRLRLAPMYDLLSTMVYGDRRNAMYIDDVRRADRVTAHRILNEADSWGLARGRASAAVADILDRWPAAAATAAAATPGVPPRLLETLESQSATLSGKRAAAPGGRGTA
ncbi:MAG: HipA domain-containing protein [Candidatus Dormibacteria bacterium]